MQRFRCICSNPVFFDSTLCLSCSKLLGYAPERRTLLALESTPDAGWRPAGEADIGERFAECANRRVVDCNWIVPSTDPHRLCRACRLNRTVPSLSVPGNAERWRALELAKRRLLRGLLELRLEFETPGPYGTPALAFAFKDNTQVDPSALDDYVVSGHLEGLVTINVAEADPAYRERVRVALDQRYRTVLGHLRHEVGHFFFDRLLRNSPYLVCFRELFGDETADYHRALATFYQGMVSPPTQAHVSAYAAAHPLEDWAECFAHLLHIEDTLETAAAFGMLAHPDRGHENGSWLQRFRTVSVALNELNRSMGQPDAYPYVVTPGVEAKLEFVRNLVRQAGHAIGNGGGL